MKFLVHKKIKITFSGCKIKNKLINKPFHKFDAGRQLFTDKLNSSPNKEIIDINKKKKLTIIIITSSNNNNNDYNNNICTNIYHADEQRQDRGCKLWPQVKVDVDGMLEFLISLNQFEAA